MRRPTRIGAGAVASDSQRRMAVSHAENFILYDRICKSVAEVRSKIITHMHPHPKGGVCMRCLTLASHLNANAVNWGGAWGAIEG